MCQKLNEDYQTKDDSTIKKGMMEIGELRYTNVKGCEIDNLVLHHSGLFDISYEFELISRARKKLIIIYQFKKFYQFYHLKSENPFFKVMKELRYHSYTCTNITCHKKKWHKKKVLEVIEVGNKLNPVLEISLD